MNIHNCSTCGNLPTIEIRRFGRTMSDPTIVNHYSYQCNPCQEKYGNQGIGSCHQTFEWHEEEDAIEEWNSIVKNNNSWYSKEYQVPVQGKLF